MAQPEFTPPSPVLKWERPDDLWLRRRQDVDKRLASTSSYFEYYPCMLTVSPLGDGVWRILHCWTVEPMSVVAKIAAATTELKFAAGSEAEAQIVAEALALGLGGTWSEAHEAFRRAYDAKQPVRIFGNASKRGTIWHPCEWCGEFERGAEADHKGFYRCRSCGEPSP